MNSLVQTTEQLLTELQAHLANVKSTHPTPLLQSKAAIPICVEHVRQLRKQLKTFRNIPREQEIHFFKYVKPKFVGDYFFYVMQYRLHYAWPMGDIKTQQLYLEEELNKIRRFFEKNHQFYCYYRTGSTYLDNLYFLRGQQDVEPTADHLLCGTDPSFYTPRDLLLAKLLANDQFQEYLLGQLQSLLSPPVPLNKKTEAPVLIWSESQYAFVELVYGLHLSRAFNGGNCDIKTIVAVLSKTFGIELKNFYDHFRYIKMRKLEPTKFTDKMKASLLQKYAEQSDLPDKM
ncbi:tetracycline regulation of excision, RteC [Pseudoflavitalea sp. G-6-1-2]|uniref:RteC domain-containing protein n=1 Tax=Pseudoflavitalea sp. G-6-1-2 TaxID=2728841 RepID=UPI00146C4044|nr:RteC domain-containing protein [Pseudoflavitalea sp. G-6-1-2]NML23882.1 tetracycline regulation of excision, RteC [Pseudoflavitalea sp. G-6-1-2]